ncbi:TetR/AcrR family transcriptional regulator [Nocardia mexicana]|nr:TetR/AcrR family transcriptional regulator [Nocardia mexicana]
MTISVRDLPEPTGDARSDRWREHRAAVRARLVEATVRAVERYGPDVSVDDIARTAGVPKPKLYRHFGDKSELFAVVAQRVQELMLERLSPRFELGGTAGATVRSALAAYVDLVAERPNLFRFLVGSHLGDRSAAQLIDGGRPVADLFANLLSEIIASRGGDGEHIEYLSDALLGAVGIGVLRWLDAPTIDRERLVDELTVIVWGALAAALRARGVVVEADESLVP